MKKGNKGFTLVELLAAIVILGILAGIGIPLIINLLTTSRDKVYLTDAKKLVAQVEYKIKANSSSIEKPDEGDCILVSMAYVDSSEFDSPPNEGKYQRENSYVLVKNNGGKLEYSVTIIEKMKKGGYRGVELIRSAQLDASNATEHIVNFKASSILNVETDVNRAFINEKLGAGYLSSDNSISAIYNYPGLDDNSATADVEGVPKIVSASLVSATNKEYNSLDATLQLKVDDKDTPRKNLKIYMSGTSYDDALASTAHNYGNNDTFSYNFDFGKAPYNKVYDGSGVKLYIVVKDPENNSTKKTMTYRLHENVAPEIDNKSTLTKRSSDLYNMTTALLKLIVTDDLDNTSKMDVCLRESNTDEDIELCDNYKKYNQYFSSDNTMQYTFTGCENGCQRDGSTHYLTVFVKDSLGGVTKKKFSYKFSKNAAPSISSFELKSQNESFTTTGSKNILVKVVATDDADRPSQLKIVINDTIKSSTYNYTGGQIVHTIDSNYDGSTKNISVSVLDTEGGVFVRKQNYTLYKNKKPTISNFTVTPANVVCSNTSLCPASAGGSKDVKISLTATDDIDVANNYAGLSVCLSLDQNSCSNYTSYSNYYNKEYDYQIAGDYDGSTKTIYAFVKDSYGEISKSSVSYKLYKNQAPVIEYADLVSVGDSTPSSGNLNTLFRINAYDDSDSTSELKIQMVEDGTTKVNNANLSNYLNHDNNYTLSGSYDGKTRNVVIKVTDSNGLSTSKTVSYAVYKNQAPVVEQFRVYSKEIPCRDAKYCPLSNNGNYKAYYELAASDDIDNNNAIQICVSETNSCTNYSSYTNYLDQEKSYTFSVDDSSKPYNGAEKHLYLFVKDSSGAITTEDFTYNLYNNKGPIIIGEPRLVSNSDYNSAGNPTNATFSVSAVDDIDSTISISYCYKKNGGSEVCTSYQNYQESKVLDNSFFNVTRPNGETFVIYAKLKDSYNKVTTTSSFTYKLIKDENPSISVGKIINGTQIRKDGSGNVVTSGGTLYTRFNINFSVNDPFDTYQVCVSENRSTCTSYRGSYKGNACTSSGCSGRIFNYNVDYDRVGAVNSGDTVNLYLFVKDSYGNVATKALYEGSYASCDTLDEETAEYTFEFDEQKTNDDLGHKQPITMDRCSRKCYAYNPTTNEENPISAYYKASIKYKDKFNNTIACNNGNPIIKSYPAFCDFKDCFYANNNYNRYAIGTKLFYDEEPWTIIIQGQSYTCTAHYDLYTTSYTKGKESITLTKTNTKICAAAFDDGKYVSTTHGDPYVIVAVFD